MSIIFSITLLSMIFYIYAGGLDISQGHIDANVPAPDVFNEILAESIDQYLMDEYNLTRPITEYKLLRDYPSQTGLAFPKYYAWISSKDKDDKVVIGVARLAAIDKDYFDITDFVDSKTITKNGSSELNAFPLDLHQKIIGEASLKVYE